LALWPSAVELVCPLDALAELFGCAELPIEAEAGWVPTATPGVPGTGASAKAVLGRAAASSPAAANPRVINLIRRIETSSGFVGYRPTKHGFDRIVKTQVE